MPVESVHEKAHILEHVHDEETVDYLDHKLGHPLTDPHGSEIPEDFVHLESGEVIRMSLLREGDLAEVESIGKLRGIRDLTVGMRVLIGPRSDDNHWTARVLESGLNIEVDHNQADEIFVRRLTEPE